MDSFIKFPNYSSSTTATKLPIKRKNPNNNPPPSTSTTTKPSPSKFHRIWTEPDEIRFLQGVLLNSTPSSDLSSFYDNFSNNTSPSSHHYTKSQLSDKLKRLRNKYRVTSSRISRGLNPNLLSPHDRAIFNLSENLWRNPNINNTINISSISADYEERINLIGSKVSLDSNCDNSDFGALDLDDDVDDDVEEAGKGNVDCCEVVARSVVKVFDECIKEVVEKERTRCRFNVDNKEDFERRWKEQKVAEIDVFARRLRLVVEDSVNRIRIRLSSSS